MYRVSFLLAVLTAFATFGEGQADITRIRNVLQANITAYLTGGIPNMDTPFALSGMNASVVNPTSEVTALGSTPQTYHWKLSADSILIRGTVDTVPGYTFTARVQPIIVDIVGQYHPGDCSFGEFVEVSVPASFHGRVDDFKDALETQVCQGIGNIFGEVTSTSP